MTAQDGLAAGTQTTRLTAEEQAALTRAEQAEATRRMAVCVADRDVAWALGVDPSAGPGTPCGSRAARVARLATGQACGTCGTPAIRADITQYQERT